MRKKFRSLTALILVFLWCFGAPLGTAAATEREISCPRPCRQDAEDPEEIRTRLLKQIKDDGWDPYSSDMTLREFYVLMAMFEDGILPLKTTADVAASKDPSKTLISRTMFYVTGLPESFMKTLPEDGATGNRFPRADWAGFREGRVYDEDGVLMSDHLSDTAAFPRYDENFYVRRITAEGIEAAVLGILYDPEEDEYVYYYLSREGEYHDVSTAALRPGEKFIIEYGPNEHNIDYRVELAGKDVTQELADTIFGTARPEKTMDGAYSFDVTGPYFYTTTVYAETATTPRTEIHGISGTQFPLGTEPVYESTEGSKVYPNTAKGPAALVSRDTFRDDSVTEDRTIIAVLEKKDAPVFDMRMWLGTSGAGGSKARGTAARADYDFERDHPGHHDIEPDGTWNWGSFAHEAKAMKREEDGTYSYVFTFQTNSDDNYVLDTLEINGTELTLPFFPGSTAAGYTDEAVGTNTGIRTYAAKTPMADGAVATVEYLYVWRAGTHAQRIYRLTVTGARSNVTVTGGNLMMYSGGAPEFVTYSLTGVHADAGKNGVRVPAIQYYDKASRSWETAAMSNVVVSRIDYGSGDPSVWGANLRFKTADGYGNPYFLWESLRGGVIDGADGMPQASAMRLDDGSVTDKNDVLPLPLPPAGTLDSQHIYAGDDGWYYIRVSTQDPYRIALLTVAAKPVRYVIRYETETAEVPAPQNIPVYAHDDPALSGLAQVDDNHGAYYDTEKNTAAAISPQMLKDPGDLYIFRYWQPVDENGDPVYDESGQALHFSPNECMDISRVNDHAVKSDVLSGDDADVFVIRLKPVWKRLTDPFRYDVVLNWIDKNGIVQGTDFSDFWDEVLTEGPETDGRSLAVYVNRQAEPLQRWLAEHPGYRFWDEMNTATDASDVRTAVDKAFAYLGAAAPDLSLFETEKDGFYRFGKYGFGVKQNGGKIVIWMIEGFNSPDTGDGGNLRLWFTLAALPLVGIVTATGIGRRRKRQR